MKTLLLSKDNTGDVEKAGKILRDGGLVAIPTETVYGLAANALDGNAVKAIYKAKGRPSDNPLIVHISHYSQLAPLVSTVPESARLLAQAFWPGPLTIILPKSPLVPKETSGGLETVAVRLPAHPVARAVIDRAGVPLAAPSANISGRPSPTTFEHVRQDLTGRVDALLDGGACQVGVESTVITLAGDVPTILRPGGITAGQLRKVLGCVDVDPAVLNELGDGEEVASPGMKYKHYSPLASVTIVDSSPEAYRNYVNQKQNCHALCFDEDVSGLKIPFVSYGTRYDGRKQAHLLFSALHYLDTIGAGKVYARIPCKRGVGLAVYNRLIRAAGFSVIRPEAYTVLGLVGPSGSGKSTVAGYLEKAGFGIIDCDAVTKSPQVYNSRCIEELSNAFGEDIAPGGVLDRRLLAGRAFATKEGKERLQAITFPRITGRVRELMAEAVKSGKRVIVLDAPTLFEAGLDRACARILAVTAPENERLSRITKRDGISEKEARLRFFAQKEDSFYTGRADYVVENSSGTDLRTELKPVIRELMEERGWKAVE